LSGAEGKIEWKRYLQQVYDIVGLPVAGFNRKNPFKNIPVLIKLLKKSESCTKNSKGFINPMS